MSGDTKSWFSQELHPLRGLVLCASTVMAFSFLLGMTSFIFRNADFSEYAETGSVSENVDTATRPMAEADAGADAAVLSRERHEATWMGAEMTKVRTALEKTILTCGDDARRRDPAFPESVTVLLQIQMERGHATPSDIRLRPETSPHFRGCLVREMPKIPLLDVHMTEWSLSFELDREHVFWQTD